MSSQNESLQSTPSAGDDQSFSALLEYLRRTRGFDFTAYKPGSLTRRVQKRMAGLSIGEFRDYLDHLEVHPDEFGQLFNTILINVTAFFRDESPWEFIRDSVIPEMLAGLRSDDPIRVWSAGCASGEEAYSIAMLLAEALGREPFVRRVKIYATDVDEEALNEARRATYAARDVEAVLPGLGEKYFQRDGEFFSFDKDLRRSVIFGRHNLIQDAPISRINLLMCRNTLMYFNAETQSRILKRFHYALVESGILFLGKAEMLLTRSELFAPVDRRLRIFTKVHRENWRDRLAGLPSVGREDQSDPMTATHLQIYGVAFDATPVAQIIVEAAGVVAMYNDRARSLFGLGPADIGRLFHELEVSYRPVELRSVIQRAQEQRRPVVVKDVTTDTAGREARCLEVQVTPLFDPGGALLGSSITFTDVSRVQELQQQLSRSKQDLETTYEELQSTNEELETTNEELQSTVEELETTNEELQSTNEELETMNEELQSTNEEMQAINEELHERSEAFTVANDFLESVLRGMRGAVIVVNRDLHVIAWNRRSEELWGLRREEAVGRNVFSLDIGLPLDQLRAMIRASLAAESELAEKTVDATNRRGRPIGCKVTCTPLMGEGRHVQGVILMIDEVEG
ncbi:MAG: chemotaxis protein CheR [Acidobacteria bacterium]|nr:MAG: chemotaxis protein CheR [Acidobacteriota bacterium]